MTVTLATILAGEDREPEIGTAYEVAPGRIVTAKYPALDLRNFFYEKHAEYVQANDPEGDYKLARILAEPPAGEAWPKNGEMAPEVVAQMVVDFFDLMTRLKIAQALSFARYASTIETTPSRSAGSETGSLPADGPSA